VYIDTWRKHELSVANCKLNDAIVFKIEEDMLIPKKMLVDDPFILPSPMPYDNMIMAFSDVAVWAFRFKRGDDDGLYRIGLIALNDDVERPMSKKAEFTRFMAYSFDEDTMELDSYYYMYKNKGDADEEVTPKFYEGTAFMSGISMLKRFLEFFSCKNIRTVKNEPNKKIQKKRARRNKLPLVSYYTLQITNSRYEKSAADGKGGWSNRVHLCRGHIMHYTAKKPHVSGFVGNMWCPPHVRGNKKKGKIVKDYELVEESE